MTGRQVAVAWQDSQLLVARMCVGLFPVARVPSWQLTQLAVMPVWLNCAGSHAMVVWQLSHSAVVTMWLASLPVAVVPLWQEEQVPVTWV